MTHKQNARMIEREEANIAIVLWYDQNRGVTPERMKEICEDEILRVPALMFMQEKELLEFKDGKYYLTGDGMRNAESMTM